MNKYTEDQKMRSDLVSEVNPEWQARMEMDERLQKENMRIQEEYSIKSAKTHARQQSILIVTEIFKELGYPVIREKTTDFIITESEKIYQYLIKDLNK